ncbi:17-beta-hydroxysteroid dehydrogenase 13-like [Uranotaenia lowii]|uniref:17-beta-hydroxysteroid dehydrogenase 13-like n=1 Tax=Uranotaenia lowii TaxID=190385 RepID=UPI00247AA20A|nr:17-beta-hydroxysteroid dehydrogenase 13-like [Uranotaenia lowii]
MSNSLEVEQQPYVAGAPLQAQSMLQICATILQLVLDFVVIFVRSVPLLVESIVEIFAGPEPKTIGGQTALITGGSNGIGKAIATELAKEGCNVVIVDLDQVNGEKTAAELRRYNVKTNVFKFDVADYEQVRELFRQVNQTVGPIDILVNNAAIVPFLSQTEKNASEIKRMMDVNVLSGFWTVEQFLPNMIRRRKGHIVAIASACSYAPVGWAKPYATSKYAVRGFMESLDEELYLMGQSDLIKTTTVFPFVINTRKHLMEKMSRTPGLSAFPKFSPELVAKTVVDAIKTNKRKVVVPNIFKAWMLNFYEHIPIKIRRMMDLTIMKGKPPVLD